MSIFWKGFALQFVNVKIYLFGITALTGFITDYSRAFPVLFLFEMIIAAPFLFHLALLKSPTLSAHR